jgi:hypothetical protein
LSRTSSTKPQQQCAGPNRPPASARHRHGAPKEGRRRARPAPAGRAVHDTARTRRAPPVPRKENSTVTWTRNGNGTAQLRYSGKSSTKSPPPRSSTTTRQNPTVFKDSQDTGGKSPIEGYTCRHARVTYTSGHSCSEHNDQGNQGSQEL